MILDMGLRLYQRPNGYWYWSKGRGHGQSLKTKDRGQARRLFRQIEREALAGRVAEITGTCRVTLGDYIRAMEEAGPSGITEGTHELNLAALRRLREQAGRSIKLDRLRPKHVRAVAAEMRTRGLAPSTINIFVRHAKSALLPAIEDGDLHANPLAGARQGPEKVGPHKFLDKKECAKLLKSMADVDLPRMIRALLVTGRRLGEMVALRWESIDLRGGKYTYYNQKARRPDTLPISDDFRAVLEAIGPRDIGPVWPRWTDSKNVSRQIKKSLRAAGLGRFKAHSLRHTFASHQAMAGVPMPALQRLLGHGDIKTTMRYAHLSPDYLAELPVASFGPADLSG